MRSRKGRRRRRRKTRRRQKPERRRHRREARRRRKQTRRRRHGRKRSRTGRRRWGRKPGASALRRHARHVRLRQHRHIGAHPSKRPRVRLALHVVAGIHRPRRLDLLHWAGKIGREQRDAAIPVHSLRGRGRRTVSAAHYRRLRCWLDEGALEEPVPVAVVVRTRDLPNRRRGSLVARRRLRTDKPAQCSLRGLPGELPLHVQPVQAVDLGREIRRELDALRHTSGDEATVLHVLDRVAHVAPRLTHAAARPPGMGHLQARRGLRAAGARAQRAVRSEGRALRMRSETERCLPTLLRRRRCLLARKSLLQTPLCASVICSVLPEAKRMLPTRELLPTVRSWCSLLRSIAS